MNSIAKQNLNFLKAFIFWILLFPGIATLSFQSSELLAATPPGPTLISPENGSSGQPLTPVLDWEDVNGAIWYDVQVATDNNFTNIVSEGTGLVISEYTVPSGHLLNGTTYYWRVTALDSIGAGPWSDVWSFTTIAAAPGAPTLISPENGSTGVNLTPTLDFTDVQNATSYGIEVSEVPDFTQLAISINDLSVSEYSVPEGVLSHYVMYYWRAFASNEGGTGPYSNVYNFTTEGIPLNPPELIFPDNNAIDVSLTPFLDFTDVTGAMSYGLQVSSTPDFLSLVVNISQLRISNYTVPEDILDYGTTYYWRANSENEQGGGPFSQPWAFTTLPDTPAAPILLSPENGSSGISLTPILDFDDVPTATGYKVQVSTSPDFSSMVLDVDIANVSEYTVPDNVLDYETTYYWRVRASNVSGSGPFSEAWDFQTLIITGITPTAELPKEYKLYQNYPNPFNPATKIKFDIPAGNVKGQMSNVKLRVYDLLGREVVLLIDQPMNPGRYEINWNAGKYASGIYFYEIKTEQYRDIKRMVLVK